MEKFIIEGGTPLSGTIVPAGNKNAALPALAATLLTSEEVVLRNTPRIRDVQAMVELLVRHRGEHRISDGFCSVDHLADWAKAGGRWR